MNPHDIIFDHYKRGSRLADTLIRHSELVRDKSLILADNVYHLKPDKVFIAEAAMLHDVGIFQTNSPQIGCHGLHPYMCHGLIGRLILESYGLPDHGMVCERHVGVGISKADIDAQQLPLPRRDMIPISIEEMIISYADLFYSKSSQGGAHSLEGVITDVTRYGNEPMERFMTWHKRLTNVSVEDHDAFN